MLDYIFYVCYIATRNNKPDYIGDNEKEVSIAFSLLLSMPIAMIFAIVTLPILKKNLSENFYENNFLMFFISTTFISGFSVYKLILKRYNYDRIKKIEQAKQHNPISLKLARILFFFGVFLSWVILMILSLFLIATA